MFTGRELFEEPGSHWPDARVLKNLAIPVNIRVISDQINGRRRGGISMNSFDRRILPNVWDFGPGRLEK